jgi:hypothetical protein
MFKFNSIEQLHHMVRYARGVARGDIKGHSEIKAPVSFRGTVKIHGANAGAVLANDGHILLQSRNRIVTLDDDNHGFAKWMYESDRFDALRKICSHVTASLSAAQSLVVYGEWCGPGIQNGVAVNKLQHRQWVLFAAKIFQDGEVKHVLNIADFKPEISVDIHNVTSSKLWDIVIDFNDDIDIGTKAQLIEEWTAEVDKVCPWAVQWGIEGTGEGIVWTPQTTHNIHDSQLVFKTKGETHKVVDKRPSNKSPLDPIVLKSVGLFVEYALTEARLLQAIEWLKETGKPLEMSSIPHYLKWIGDDIQRECHLELQDSQLSWKQVAKNINNKCLDFYKAYITKL